MFFALINEQTGKVENKIAPPEGTNVWFCPIGYIAVETETAEIGDTFDFDTETFVKPEPVEPPTPPAPVVDQSLIIKRDKIQAALNAYMNKETLTVEDEGMIASLENSLENIVQKLGG